MHLRRSAQPRRGVVLLAVLVVVVLLSLAAYRYSDYMLGEYRAADASGRALQAKAWADSGVHYTAALLAGNIDETLGGKPYDNPEKFQNVAMPGDEKSKWKGKFTIISLRSPDEGQDGQPYRYGVTDESGKINLNAILALDKDKGDIAKKILMGLPNMTEEAADSIVDWIDPDETPRANGAENEYYGGLDPPARCKNGPLDTLDELLLVKGVTAQLLYGGDRNRNGILDEGEEGEANDQGWSAYLTIYSREMNISSKNKPKIYVNDEDMNAVGDKLNAELGEELANFIIAYRLYGGTPATSTPGSSRFSPLGGTQRTGAQTQIGKDRGNSRKKKTKINSLWDLVNSTVNIKNGNQTITLPSPLSDPGQQRTLLPLLLDRCTTSKDSELTPRINVNTAPSAVITALKDAAKLTDADIQGIISKRPALGSTNEDTLLYKTSAWLLTEANLTIDKCKALDKFLTGRGQVYRFQAIGHFDNGGPTARIEAVVDTNMGRPRIVYWRDLSELGKGFDLGTQGD